MEEVVVMIVGAGPSGLATSACLNHLSIPNIVLEKEDCCGSLWKKRSYDRLHLHLDKDFCALPFKPHAPSTPTFMPKDTFIEYLDAYVSEFDLKPRFHRTVESATFDGESKKWRVEAKNGESGEIETYVSQFLVVASGENDVGFIPDVPGLEGFGGDIVHSNNYKNGSKYEGKDVLVVGCGNSGMEISYDLYNFKANTSIVIKAPFHVLTRDMVQWGMQYARFLPLHIVDTIVSFAAVKLYGDLSEYGIVRPAGGPFYLKEAQGRSPVIDVGTVDKIKSGEIQVFPGIVRINGNEIEFENDTKKRFHAIVFATGYKSLNDKWLNIKEEDRVLDERSMPRKPKPNHFKGVNGLYCAGFSRMGIDGISRDAKAIADDIHKALISCNGNEEHCDVPVIAEAEADDDQDHDDSEVAVKCGSQIAVAADDDRVMTAMAVNLDWQAAAEAAIAEAGDAIVCNWKAVVAAIIAGAAVGGGDDDTNVAINCKGEAAAEVAAGAEVVSDDVNLAVSCNGKVN